MGRKILLVEPNYKNKYPPMGLMKLATYHRRLGDEVVFYKGEFRDFIVQEIYEELIRKLCKIDADVEWYRFGHKIKQYIVRGYKKDLEYLIDQSESKFILENLTYYRDYYRKKIYFKTPKWDRICICTLFTFHWKKTVETINMFKTLCKSKEQIFIGGVAASVLPKELEKDTGIKPWEGLLNKRGILDDNDIIIDNLPLDYSILEEIDYTYPENNAYYGYMTRGCVNRCHFCLVPVIEPEYNQYISMINQIQHIRDNFGEKRNLLLLDNNVLASDRFNEIIDEIKKAGFDKTTKYVAPNKYEVSINALRKNYNNKAYIRSTIKQYKQLMLKLSPEEQKNTYAKLKEYDLLDVATATRDNILAVYEHSKLHFEKFYGNRPKIRYVDFNQGLEAKLLTDEKMRKLSEIPIRPLRIAFDTWGVRKTYKKAVKIAANYNITNMSNYLLYNYNDKPIELFYRLKMNIDLCEELKISIYSFPMKYHPILETKYFSNRTYIGKYWNRKYIRAIQAILNATKGKIGKGKSFFEEAFGKNEEEFEKLLYMPEALIIYRMHYKNNGITDEWWEKFKALSQTQNIIAKEIIRTNIFNSIDELDVEANIKEVLYYYKIKREDAESELSSFK
ncbi:MAG: hypothetical protein ACLKAK_09975 [Alkaliphilus sp.]